MFVFLILPSSLSCGYPCLFNPPFRSYFNESDCLLLVWEAVSHGHTKNGIAQEIVLNCNKILIYYYFILFYFFNMASFYGLYSYHYTLYMLYNENQHHYEYTFKLFSLHLSLWAAALVTFNEVGWSSTGLVTCFIFLNASHVVNGRSIHILRIKSFFIHT